MEMGFGALCVHIWKFIVYLSIAPSKGPHGSFHPDQPVIKTEESESRCQTVKKESFCTDIAFIVALPAASGST